MVSDFGMARIMNQTENSRMTTQEIGPIVSFFCYFLFIFFNSLEMDGLFFFFPLNKLLLGTRIN